MSVVVNMLEGSLEIPKTLNPFQHLFYGTNFATQSVQLSNIYTTTVTSSASSVMVSDSSIVCATPIMRKYEIELASSIV